MLITKREYPLDLMALSPLCGGSINLFWGNGRLKFTLAHWVG
jgi:hypothetical protein